MCARRYKKKGKEQDSPTPKVNPTSSQNQDGDWFKRFSSTQEKQKKAIAEISKSLAQVDAIGLAKVACRNSDGDTMVERSCDSQNQGTIVPTIVKSKYSVFIVLDEWVVVRFGDFNIVFNLNRYAMIVPSRDNQSNYL